MELSFKKIHEDNIELIMNWRMKPEVKKYMYTEPELNLEIQKEWYMNRVKFNEREKYWLINVDNTNIGLISLSDIDTINKRCYWAYYIGELEYLGKGIGKQVELNILDYVFNELKLNKLCCEVFVFNEAVIKLHERFGSKIEGTLRKHIYKNGEYFDIVTMGILNHEWQAIRNTFQINNAKFEGI